jgi:hypothetical protein
MTKAFLRLNIQIISGIMIKANLRLNKGNTFSLKEKKNAYKTEIEL